MQIILQGNDPEPVGVLFMMPNGELAAMPAADGRRHVMSDGRVVYDLGDCNAPAQPRPMDLSQSSGFFVDDAGIIRRA